MLRKLKSHRNKTYSESVHVTWTTV